MLTAQELNITEAEHVALQAVAAGLAAGLYVHLSNPAEQVTRPKMFNMNIACERESCGTAGCIGGWVGLEMGKSSHDASYYVSSLDEESPLDPLYYPPEDCCVWSDITPAIAAEAIYQFLDGKPVDYPKLLANSPAA